MSDPECYQFFAHPRVSEIEILKEERGQDGDGGLVLGMEVVEAALSMRGRGVVMGGLCCLPVTVRAWAASWCMFMNRVMYICVCRSRCVLTPPPPQQKKIESGAST